MCRSPAHLNIWTDSCGKPRPSSAHDDLLSVAVSHQMLVAPLSPHPNETMLLPQTHTQFHFPIPPKTLNPVFPNPKPLFFPSLLRSRSITSRVSASSAAAEPPTVPDSAIRHIADKLRSLGFSPEPPGQPPPSSSSAGEIFVPLPSRLLKHRVGHTIDTSWSTPEYPVPDPGGDGGFVARYSETRRRSRAERLSRKDKERVKGEEEKAPTLAELRLSAGELRLLRMEGLKLTKKLKVGKAGITEGIVNGIHERWRSSELVKIACEDLCRKNMRRTHDLLEVCLVIPRKT